VVDKDRGEEKRGGGGGGGGGDTYTKPYHRCIVLDYTQTLLASKVYMSLISRCMMLFRQEGRKFLVSNHKMQSRTPK